MPWSAFKERTCELIFEIRTQIRCTLSCECGFALSCFRFMFDEPSSYLDVKQRLKAAVAIRDLLAVDKFVIVVEHD